MRQLSLAADLRLTFNGDLMIYVLPYHTHFTFDLIIHFAITYNCYLLFDNLIIMWLAVLGTD